MTVHEYRRYKRRYELRARERVPKVRAVGICQDHTARGLHERKWVPHERSTSCLVCVSIMQREVCMWHTRTTSTSVGMCRDHTSRGLYVRK